MKPKFKKGDVCKVVARNKSGADEGSPIRNDFIIKTITDMGPGQPIYFPTDGKRGAFEEQLRYQKQTLSSLIE